MHEFLILALFSFLLLHKLSERIDVICNMLVYIWLNIEGLFVIIFYRLLYIVTTDEFLIMADLTFYCYTSCLSELMS